jgi:hypothetical protein
MRRAEGRKVFFFEKKKQKTFTSLSRTYDQHLLKNKSFLLLFFKKEDLFYPFNSITTGTWSEG